MLAQSYCGWQSGGGGNRCRRPVSRVSCRGGPVQVGAETVAGRRIEHPRGKSVGQTEAVLRIVADSVFRGWGLLRLG
jgi:hypothetical protein